MARGKPLGDPVSVVEQLQLQKEAPQIQIEALLREKAEWAEDKANMKACLRQSALRLRRARKLKNQAKAALSDAHDELRPA